MLGEPHGDRRAFRTSELALFAFAPLVATCLLILSQPASALPPASPPSTPGGLLHKVDVLGADERKRVPDRHRTVAEGIGLLWQRGTGRACSAFCVGDNLIATNAHCVVRIDKRPVRNLHLFRFMLAPETGVVERRHVSSLLFTAPDQPQLSFYAGNRKGQESLRSMEHDWAFARLAKPLCRGKALRFVDEPTKLAADSRPAADKQKPKRAPEAKSETAQRAREDRLFMIAYHGDRDLQDRWFSGDCDVRPAKRSGLIFHTCDTFKGSSGAPLLRLRNGMPEVVAINVGTYEFSRYRVTRLRTRSGRIRKRRRLLERSVVNVAVKPDAFLAGLQRFRNETLIPSVSDFRSVQEHLRDAGLYRGRIDGLYGPLSRRAILAYERKHGLKPLGLPTRELLDRLSGQTAQHNLAKPTPNTAIGPQNPS